MKEIEEILKKYKDDTYAKFQVKLTPGISLDNCIGVRIPNVRNVAKQINGTTIEQEFLKKLPHKYYDENMLHSIILSSINSFDTAMYEVERFLPYVDNWATCDTMHPKGFSKNKNELMKKIKIWIKSSHTYTVRFAIDCLMTYFLDDSFDKSHLDMAGSIKTNEYYINMMIAWYFATALAKQYDETIKYIESKKLSKWVQNKTIQKAKESFRISEETKQYLEALRIN